MTVSVAFLSTQFQRHNIRASFPVAHRVTYEQGVQSDKTGGELIAQFQAYSDDIENGVKGWSCFSAPDENRDASFTLTPVGDPVEGLQQYTCSVTFTINATAFVDLNCDVNKPAEEASVEFQAAGDAAVAQWFAERSQFVAL